MSALGDKGITLEGLAAAADSLRQELATWKALARKQDALSADQITATQSGATAAKISQIAVNTAAIQSLAAQVAGQISLEYVTTLPATGEPLTLYLVPQGDGTAPNYCNEYLWINNAWELIGTTGAMANNGELTIQVNGVAVGTFTANQAANAAVNITVPTNTNQLVNGAQFVDAAALQAALALKQNSLNTAQLEAVNSGITAAGVQQIADNATAIAGKQDALTTAQQAAVDSGATAAKIDQIASNASAIVSLTSSKQDALSTTQLAAVNSGVTAAAVQQIGTNADNITALQTAVSSKAADDQVVHLAGAETITGDKTWTGINAFTNNLRVSNSTNKYLLVQNTSDDWVLGASTPSSTKEFGGIGYRDKNEDTTFYCITYHNTSGDVFTRFNMRWKYTNGAKSTTGSNVQTTFEVGLDNTGNKYVSTNGSWKTNLTPYASATYDLGTSSNKWKTLNGINPGALSLPDTYLNLDTTDWNLAGTSFNYVPSIDGWLFINVRPNNNYAYVAIEAAHMRNNSENTTGRNAMACIAVRKNVSTTITLVGASIAQARLVLCAGNV